MMEATKSSAAKLAFPPIKRRYLHSAQMVKTNLAFGDDRWGPLTTYDKDYTAKMPMPPDGMREEPSCRDSHMQRILVCTRKKISLQKITFVWIILINLLRLRQNDHHLTDDIFKHIFLNENVGISIQISLKFVSYVLTTSQHWFR